MTTKLNRARWIFSVVLIVAVLGSACRGTKTPTAIGPVTATPPSIEQATPAGESPTSTAAEPTPVVPALGPEAAPAAPVFARFLEPPVNAVPAVEQEAIAADLSNVYNPFVLSPEQIARLGQDGFVVSPGNEKEFFTVYEKARYANVPIFVTSDSLLHSYHLLFDKVLRTAETEHFIPLLRELNAALLQQVDEQYQALTGTAWEENALRTVAFVGVASRLLDPAAQVPGYAASLVEQELALIDAAAGILPSPLFPLLDFGEDYTQYIPRGHYTRSEALKAYFKSMMWYGRMTFRLKTENPENGRIETRSALLLVKALLDSQVQGRPAVDTWSDLYSPTVFFVGRSDDLTVLQYAQVMENVYGADAGLEQITDEARLDSFIEQADQLPPPRILGIVIAVDQDETKTTKGMRFMGQRFVPDAYIFRQLIYRNVGTASNRRGLPKGLDIPAAMGSERAYQILEDLGETSYENYPQQMEKMRTWLTGLSTDEWTETLYNSWLYSFYPLLDEPGQGYPAFMQSRAWLDKQLNTVLGSWAELKHDTILYAKQVYAEMGGGPPPPQPVPPLGYVEPVPQFYARLAALTAMTSAGLQNRGLLGEQDQANLQRLHELVTAFQAMAEKELRAEPLTQEELDTIRFYGGELEHLVMAAADSDAGDPFAQKYMDEEPQAAVIADVATDPDHDNNGVPSPMVLEEAVGRINEIHVVVPVIQPDGAIFLQVAKGGVFSYYEFAWPADDRLTDEKWRQMLEQGEAPELPEWTASFLIPQGEYSELQTTIAGYQRDLTGIFWELHYLDLSGNQMPVGYELFEQFRPELVELRQAKRFIGRQLVSANYTSFDLQSETRAVVVVRETWDEKLYAGENLEDGAPLVAQRGPYSVNVTYTLVFAASDDRPAYWKVESAVYDSRAPEWK